jgi:hypothetical protein
MLFTLLVKQIDLKFLLLKHKCEGDSLDSSKRNTVKPVYNEHRYNEAQSFHQ